MGADAIANGAPGTLPEKPPAGEAEEDRWDVEDSHFWATTGKRVAFRNLAISVPALLLAFAVWLYWSIVIVQMRNLAFPFTQAQLYTLPALAGLTGATLRIPNSFLIAVSGGRNVIGLTTFLLAVPALGVGIALADPTTSYVTFAIFAALSGIGGGAFASSMSNISFFFPKRMQGLALGVNAGVGNLGVSVAQILVPYVMTFGLFGALAGAPRAVPEALGGGSSWIQNAGLVWVPLLLVVALLAFFLMNNLPMHRTGPAPIAIGKAVWLEMTGLIGSAVGIALLLGVDIPIPDLLKTLVVLTVTTVVTLALMRYAAPRAVRESLKSQFVIFREKHNWTMTWLYVMTFGSFIGFSAAFPKLIQDVFGRLPDGSANPLAPDPMAYAWLGPLVGSIARPIGGWISDKWGGARVTHWTTVVMIGATLGVAWFVRAASGSDAPQDVFWPFFALFMLLFITTGVGNGSTFRMVPVIFEPKLAGPVLGWTSAIAAYGSFIIPRIFGQQIENGTPEYALYGFAAYYLSCVAVNWWYFARKNAEVPC